MMPFRKSIFWALVGQLAAHAACGDDLPSPSGASSTSGDTPPSLDSSTGTPGLDTGSGGDAPADCEEQYPLPFPDAGLFDSVFAPDPSDGYLIDVSTVCPDTASTYGLGADLEAFIYRPSQTGSEEWPSSRLPLLLFVSGAGISVSADGEQTYDYLLSELARNGFVVAAVEVPFVGWNQQQRQGALLCTLLWLDDTGAAGWDQADQDRLNCDIGLMGHSRGGMAVQNTLA